jgi:hypothetical protein
MFRMGKIAVAVTASLALAGQAAAKPVAYSGTTSGGDPISFERTGNTVKRVSAYIPTTCVPAWPGFTPRVGSELFTPPGRLGLGREVRKTALQDTALHHSEVTKNYRFDARKRARGAIGGRLHVNFSFQTLGYTSSFVLVGYVCQGDATFRARPVRR